LRRDHRQQDLPDGVEDDDDDDDDSDDSDEEGAPQPDADGKVTLQILKGNLGYGIDISDSADAVGLADIDENPAKAAGVPIPSKIFSVNGIEVKTKRDITSALRMVPAGVAAEFIFQTEQRSSPQPSPPPPVAAAPASSTSTAGADNGTCSDPEKAQLLQVSVVASSLLPCVSLPGKLTPANLYVCYTC
jgi:hypothetical protein